ncbi:MAG TPA: O-antigen ligase family protein [Candidatus Binatia bacterium]|nr:O-antigen ligase family protein [Candidatus Binatia bacterium]
MIGLCIPKIRPIAIRQSVIDVGCDRIVTGGILLLVLFTPLAFGCVHPWAVSLVEAVVFLLVLVWMGKLIFFTANRSRLQFVAFKKLAIPLAAFVGFLGFQLLPVPPALLRILSPSTYELYRGSLPGWPEKTPYENGFFQPPNANQKAAENPSEPEPPLVSSPASGGGLRRGWRSLSIASAMTKAELLKIIAYVSFFFLILFYPFRQRRERPAANEPPERPEPFVRLILFALLLSGLVVSVIGFAQRFTGNGKILWFFVPVDWGVPMLGDVQRASGSFVNPDHFANYLALILPIVLACAFFRAIVLTGTGQVVFQLLSGLVAMLVLTGILLSLSRGGWASAVVGAMGFLFLVSRCRGDQKTRPSSQPRSTVALRLALATIGFLVVLSLVFVGPGGRGPIDKRWQETTVQDASLDSRISIWRDTVKIIGDFPLFGVGLGGWQDLFPRYQSPPWSWWIYREAHNDYLELLAEVGIVGFAFLAWFFYRCGGVLFTSLGSFSTKTQRIFCGFLSAVAVMAFHEFFDFSMQIPANALLFVLLLALALRMTLHSTIPYFSVRPVVQAPKPSVLWPGAGVVGAIILFAVSLSHEVVAFPYDFQKVVSPDKARERILSHPARSDSRLSMLKMVGEAAPSWQLRELEIALWLDPINPYIRDLYALSLLKNGRRKEALRQMSQSVFHSPSPSSHFYLGEGSISRLSKSEQDAVEVGFKRALKNEYPGAMAALAGFYGQVNRFAESGQVYKKAALSASDSTVRTGYLLNAGLAYIKAGEESKAEALFREASAANPQDSRPYQQLATLILANRGDLKAAKAAVSEGIGNGAEPVSLYMSLAEAAQKAGSGAEEKEALREVLELRPSSHDATFRLGLLHLQEKEYDRAALYFGKAARINPNSPAAFYHLGVAEEERYAFSAAARAYGRAVELSPNNLEFSERFEALKRKVAENQELRARGSIPSVILRPEVVTTKDTKTTKRGQRD